MPNEQRGSGGGGNRIASGPRNKSSRQDADIPYLGDHPSHCDLVEGGVKGRGGYCPTSTEKPHGARGVLPQISPRTQGPLPARPEAEPQLAGRATQMKIDLAQEEAGR